jgi:hypothetical protein
MTNHNIPGEPTACWHRATHRHGAQHTTLDPCDISAQTLQADRKKKKANRTTMSGILKENQRASDEFV